MKYIIAGDWKHHMYEQAWSKALKKREIEVIPFSWKS